jgi:hypothetical protein
MSACALFIIGITRSWRDRCDGGCGSVMSPTAGFRHDPKTRSAAATALARSTSPTMITVVTDGANRAS